MLPSLTAAFLVGLVAGSQTPYFPLVVSALLLATAILLTVSEEAGLLDARHGGLWFAALLLGILYWVLSTPLPSVHEMLPSRDNAPSEISGRIRLPCQDAPGRQAVLVLGDEAPAHKIRLVWRDPGTALLEGDRI